MFSTNRNFKTQFRHVICCSQGCSDTSIHFFMSLPLPQRLQIKHFLNIKKFLKYSSFILTPEKKNICDQSIMCQYNIQQLKLLASKFYCQLIASKIILITNDAEDLPRSLILIHKIVSCTGLSNDTIYNGNNTSQLLTIFCKFYITVFHKLTQKAQESELHMKSKQVQKGV